MQDFSVTIWKRLMCYGKRFIIRNQKYFSIYIILGFS